MNTFPFVKKTSRMLRPEFGPALPVYEGAPCPQEFDWRVQTEDGAVCYVWEDSTGNEPAPILCTELVALDAGHNVQRRRKASEGDYAGLGAPMCRGDAPLFLCPADSAVVGYYVRVT